MSSSLRRSAVTRACIRPACTVVMRGTAQQARDQKNHQLMSVLSFRNTSSITGEGNLQTNSACLAFQSRLFTWSDKITPLIFKSSGINTSKGYPLT